ncbi:MAG: class I SAM-dependent methyltransferase [Nitrospinae bacterium]|nr:class I SAM-dependent methyltransferase [Nitrospinota bacterium]
MPLSLLRDLADKLLRLPELKGFEGKDFDSARAAEIERQVLRKKPALATLYNEYCRPFVESANRAGPGATMVEIGSGTSPLKDKVPGLITSDVTQVGWLDLSMSAFEMPFKSSSVDRLFLMFVCHHLGRFEDFLNEARRVLKPGGEMVIVDPAITPFSKLYYKIHVDKMDVTAKEWGFEGDGRLTDSNIALAWMAFFRDREKFQRMYPEFKIEKVEYNTCLSFLLTGGFRIRQLLPTFAINGLFALENWIIRNVTSKIAVTMAVTVKRV